MQTVADGIQHLLKGFKLIRQPGVRWFVLIPFSINLLVFSGLIWLAADRFDQLLGWLQPDLPEWLAWLAWLAWLLFGLLAVLLVFYTFTLVANLIGAPFNGLLAERVAISLGLPAAKDGDQPLLKQMLTDVKQEVRKLLYFLVRALGLGVISLVLIWTPLAPLVPLLWFAFSAWMLSLEYSDFHLANQGLDFASQRRLLGRHRWAAMGFGAAATGATLVPLLNFLVMPAAVAGAVSFWSERLDSDAGNGTASNGPSPDDSSTQAALRQ
ncbi:MAG: sulfate transporter CysZ [Gammaproteobacteria bacterium]|nr:sulfate transporter CysZ [Gammaproteobacteria bacterium]